MRNIQHDPTLPLTVRLPEGRTDFLQDMRSAAWQALVRPSYIEAGLHANLGEG